MVTKYWLLGLALAGATAGCTHPQLPAAEYAARSDDEAPHGVELVDIARAFAASGDRVRAIQYLTLAQREGVAPQRVVPRLLALYVADGQYRMAIDTAESYLRRKPHDHTIRRCLGAFYMAIDATDDALRTFERLIVEAPRDADAHFALASLLSDGGTQHAKADEHYRTYLALAPTGRHAEEARAKVFKELP